MFRYGKKILMVLAIMFALNVNIAQAADCSGSSKSSCSTGNACTWVSGYSRKDGTKVRGYCRAKGKSGEARDKKKSKDIKSKDKKSKDKKSKDKKSKDKKSKDKKSKDKKSKDKKSKDKKSKKKKSKDKKSKKK